MKKKVVCDNCKHEFVITKLHERKYIEKNKKMREVWFNCPCCGARFNCYKGVDKTGEFYVAKETADEV